VAIIRHRVGVQAERDELFDALILPEKLIGWWPTTAHGTPQVGGRLELTFPGYPNHVWEILELVPGERVHLRCEDGPGPWLKTELRFELHPTESQVFVTLEHLHLDAESDAYLYFNTKWPTFLLSLKNLLETGRGQPYPNDLRIQHD